MRRPARTPALIVLVLLVAGTTTAAAEEPLDPLATGPGRYVVEWQVHESVHEDKGHLKDGQSRDWRFRVDEWNVTRAVFEVSWKDREDALRMADPPEFSLAVHRPEGTRLPGSPARGTEGRILVPSGVVAPVPEPVEMDAKSREDAHARLASQQSDAGRGVWDVTVTLEDAGRTGSRLADGQDYELKVTLYYYQPVVLKVVSVGQPSGIAGATGLADAPKVWLGALGGLTVVALALGVALLRQERAGAHRRQWPWER